VLDSLTDMIRIHRNHPSIVAWSMSNEPFFTTGGTMSKVSGLLTKSVNLSRQLDPTRPAGIGGAQRPEDSTRIDKLGDIAGYNGDGGTIATFQNPGIANMVTEYGSTSSARPATGSAAALKLSASTTTLSAVDGTQDAQILVSIVDSSGKQLSNTAPVTLTIKSGPGEFPTGPGITFLPPSSSDPQADMVIRDGQAGIEFRTYDSGTTVIEATSSGLASDSITITSQGSPAYVAGTTPAVAARPYKRY
jgi:hypothetical protein